MTLKAESFSTFEVIILCGGG